jgi:hypothetical protein
MMWRIASQSRVHPHPDHVLMRIRSAGCAADGKNEHEQEDPHHTDNDSNEDHGRPFLQVADAEIMSSQEKHGNTTAGFRQRLPASRWHFHIPRNRS